MSQRKVRWGDLRMPEIYEVMQKKNAVLIPLGATEQHGLHMPVNFDTHSTVYFAEEAARRVIEQNPEWGVLVAPEIAYADCYGRPTFDEPVPGSISISIDTQIALIYDIVDNLIEQGFRNILLLSGHMENQSPTEVALRKLEIKWKNSDLGLFATNTWLYALERWTEICNLGFAGLGHAGERETAVALNTQPDDVITGPTYPEAVFKGALSPKYSAPICGELVFHSSRIAGVRQDGLHLKDGGVTTEEQAAKTKELGRQLMEFTISDLVEVITQMISTEGSTHDELFSFK